eukprot:scaffold10914_cov21-Tisochrysis_lutea.AAC.1
MPVWVLGGLAHPFPVHPFLPPIVQSNVACAQTGHTCALTRTDTHTHTHAHTRARTRTHLRKQDRAALVSDVRKTRNKGVQRAHERLFRDLAKQQEDDRERRLEALRANDFEAYQELLIQQQTVHRSKCCCECMRKFMHVHVHAMCAKWHAHACIRVQRESGLAEDDDRFHAITRFLSETEDYLNKLASKIAM